MTSPLSRFVGLDRGRARFSVRTEQPPTLPHVDHLLAGAATVDITPPPGMPKAGYSSNAHTGDGFRSRIRARITHLRCGRASMALVQLDLLGGSSVLQHLVATRIAEVTDIPLAGLMIGATHTHAGPGQFNGTDFYNQFASNRPGFDPAWAEFLVERISAGVIEAYETRRPARLAVGTCEVWGLTRNRSLDPYVKNDTVSDKRTEPQRKFSAINPELHLIRVDAERRDAAGKPDGFEPLSAAVVFSVHGTGISQHVCEYNADLWAYLVDELGHQIETDRGSRGVVGAQEGSHADVAPAILPGRAGHLEAERLGRGIGREAAELYRSLDDELSDDVPLGYAFREIDLDVSNTIDGITIADHPAIGAALTAGAKENPTPVLHLIPPFRSGTPKPIGNKGPHGDKWILFGQKLQGRAFPRRMFPRVLPVQILRIGSMAILGMAFEVTVESGTRFVAAAERGQLGADVQGPPIERYVVSSVTNEYSGYVATPEEYARQYYEGGHTLYGPNTQAFLAAHAGHLAADLASATDGVVADAVTERKWDLKIRRFLAKPDARHVGRSAAWSPRYVDATPDADGYWEFVWRDTAVGNLRWHEPLVRLEQTDSPDAFGPDAEWVPAVHRGYRVDDQGCDVEVRVAGTDKIGDLFAARWHNPAFRVGRRHRFVVVANAGQPELVSVPFD